VKNKKAVDTFEITVRKKVLKTITTKYAKKCMVIDNNK